MRSSFFAWLPPRTVVQELGREGILPFSSFFASNRPFNAPLAGLFTEYLVSCIYLIAVPPGDAYIFLINSKSWFWTLFFKLRFVAIVVSYAMTVVNALISFGLLLLYLPPYRIWDWNPPFRAPKTVISVYFLSNLFLVVVPFFPPASRTYEKLPYWVCYSFFFFFWGGGWLRSSTDSFSRVSQVAFNRQRHRHIPWYHILVYLGYLTSKKGRILPSARVG